MRNLDYEKYNQKISILCSMHCDRRIASHGLSCDTKCRKHIFTNAHSCINLWIILWNPIRFGMWNYYTLSFKCGNIIAGMPPAMMLPQMMIELAVYGLVAGLCSKYIPQENEMSKLYMSLIIAMLAGRIVNGFVNTFILSTQGYTLSVFMTASFITCLPGIILQLIVVPILVRILNKTAA